MALKHGKLSMPLAMHPYRPSLGPSLGLSHHNHMIRRPVLLPQQARPLPGHGPGYSMIMGSPSQHNYVLKKKPHFRVPGGMAAVSGVLSSTTLRPLYLPASGFGGGLGSMFTTLRPAHPQVLQHSQLPQSAQFPQHSQLPQHSQYSSPNPQHPQHAQLSQYSQHSQAAALYTTKLQKLAAAAPTSTSTPAPTTTAHSVQSVHSFPGYHHRPAGGATSYHAEQSASQEHPLLAVNTGFNPSSVVVEGGFKPVIQRRQDVAEDRMAFVEGGDDDDELMEGSVVEMERRSSDVSDEDEEEEEQAEEREGEVRVGELSEQQQQQQRRTETFEPMFIPSPPDRNAYKAKKASDPGKLPKARGAGKRDKPAQLSPLVVRPRPAILRRPLYPNMLVPPFKIPPAGARGHRERKPEEGDDDLDDVDVDEPEKREDGGEDEQDETMMAAERMDTYYLPPASTIVTYDGKAVDADIAASIPNPPPDTQHSPGTAELVRGTPQFGPFLGEVPPPVPAAPSPLDLPQLQAPAAPAQYPGLPPLPLSAVSSDQEGAAVRERRSAEPHHEPGHEGHDDHPAAGSAPSSTARAGLALSLLCAMLVSALSATMRNC